jgi:heme-degrading monooxygenase HmoA
MASLAENLAPPYYAAILDEPQNGFIDFRNGAPADHMVTLATRQPGFLGLETSRDPAGRRVTVSYWKDIAAIEGWKTAGDRRIHDRFGLGLEDTLGIRVARVDAPGGLEGILQEVMVAAHNTEVRGLTALLFAAFLSLASGLLP